MVHPKAIITLAAIAAFPALLIFSQGNFSTNIRVENKVEGFNSAAASWSLEKTTASQSLDLGLGESANLNYVIKVTKELVNQGSGAKGNVCIKNQSKGKTEALTATTQIQTRESFFRFKDIAGATATQNFEPIEPRSTACQDFQIDFSSQENSKRYRAVSSVIIKKTERQKDRTTVVKDSDIFTMPSQTSSSEAEITDAITCPQGYNCLANDVGPWKISDSSTINYNISLENTGSACGVPSTLTNRATLRELVTNNDTSAQSSVTVNANPC